ncbi:uncharacterized protein PV09_02105 [Verruconis gallopava]|uniref:Uncharacterized protein n=1 Tax=Verruconis gallopava TaxID=253628 RepID=A0A0D2AL42_9PEZI|nr:uncharacterized protein PV09_02105 [Verruconis gallopava]KIW07250.1 hypothetical protein PV09_02105 [Verruconis gallopava]
MFKRSPGSTSGDDVSRKGRAKPRPAGYKDKNPHNLVDAQRRAEYLQKYWWIPASGTAGLPKDPMSKQARVDKLFAAMTDFSDVWDSDNIFTEGRSIDNDDIEYACMRIGDAIDDLHRNGLCVPHIADPTMKEVLRKQKRWRVDTFERDMTATEREDAIADHLRHYKKACLDAIDRTKELSLLFVAAPITAGKRRDANAKSNYTRKKRSSTFQKSRFVTGVTEIDRNIGSGNLSCSFSQITPAVPLTDRVAYGTEYLNLEDKDVQISDATSNAGCVSEDPALSMNFANSMMLSRDMLNETQTVLTENSTPFFRDENINADVDWIGIDSIPEMQYDWLSEPDGYLIGR